MRLDRCEGCTHTREGHDTAKDGGHCRHPNCDCDGFARARVRLGTSLPRRGVRRLGAGHGAPGVRNSV